MVAFIYFITILATNFGLLFAQAASATPDDLGGWLALVNVGLAGVGLVAFVRGWIVPGVIHDQAIAREKASQEEIQKLRVHVEELVEDIMEFKNIQGDVVVITDKFLKLLEEDKIRKEATDKAAALRDINEQSRRASS